MAQLTYKKLTAEDVPAYLDLLKKMAKFEELEDIFVCTEEMLQKYIVEELPVQARSLSGRSVYPAGAPGQRLRQADPGLAGSYRGHPRLRPL